MIERLLELGLRDRDIEKLLERGKLVEEELDGLRYLRVGDDIRNIERGTVVFENGDVIRGYPRIARILNLENGVRKHFGEDPFYVEEKVDGYNVRVASIGGRIVAITRGGFLCPFTTERLEDFFDARRFFSNHDDLVLCGEVAGPDNPYVSESPPYIEDDVAFFLFDIRRKNTGEPLPVDERMRLADRYEIPHVRSFGKLRASEIDKLRNIIRELNEEGCEGVVLKDPEMRKPPVKYVTPMSNVRDIRIGSRIPIELPAGYYYQRILRLAFQLAELPEDVIEDRDFYYRELGRALLEEMSKAIREVSRGGTIRERFAMRVRDMRTAQKMIEMLEKKTRIDVVSIERIGDYWRIVFDKVYERSTKVARDLWNGRTLKD